MAAWEVGEAPGSLKGGGMEYCEESLRSLLVLFTANLDHPKTRKRDKERLLEGDKVHIRGGERGGGVWNGSLRCGQSNDLPRLHTE